MPNHAPNLDEIARLERRARHLTARIERADPCGFQFQKSRSERGFGYAGRVLRYGIFEGGTLRDGGDARDLPRLITALEQKVRRITAPATYSG